MSQMRTATGSDICSMVKRSSQSATPGHWLPMNVPAAMQSATHSVRYRSKTFMCFFEDSATSGSLRGANGVLREQRTETRFELGKRLGGDAVDHARALR